MADQQAFAPGIGGDDDAYNKSYWGDPRAGRKALEMAQNHCATFGQVARTLAIRPEEGGKNRL
jgi:hypothetical protein